MIARSATLRAHLTVYALRQGLAPSTSKAYGYIVGSLESYLARPATMADLNVDTVNTWLAWLRETGRSPETIRSKRRGLLTLWRWLAEESDLPAPAKIHRVRVPVRVPSRTWTQDELARLVAAAGKVPGRFASGVPRGPLLLAWVLVGYYSGLRLGDLLALRFDQISGDGVVAVVQHKTGHAILCDVGPALGAVEAVRWPKRSRILGDAAGRTVLLQAFAELVALAGVRGSSRWLRSTGATWCEVAASGSAMAYLGHRTPGLAYKHYVDPRFVQRGKTRPPEII